jgi:hypothetical protein
MTAPFNVGHDAVIDIVDGATGLVITSFPPTTHFSFQQITQTDESSPVNEKPLFREIPKGWRGTIEYDRRDPSIDLYFASQEAAYWAGVGYFPGTITQTTTEQDGTTSTFKYNGAALKYDDAGSFKAADKVMVRLSWMASDRVPVI